MGKTFYRLGGKASYFFDPLQSREENKEVHTWDAKELESTELVQKWANAGGLVKLSESEADEFLSDEQKKKAAAEKVSGAKLDVAAQKDLEADVKLKEADNKLAAIADIEKENADVKDENSKLKARLAELENPDTGTKKGK